jgi:hypothetical protein
MVVACCYAGTTAGAGDPLTGSAPGTTSGPVGSLEAEPESDSFVDEFIADLAAAGIGVFAVGGTEPMVPVTDPVSPLRLTEEQAANAALGAASGSGLSGAQIDGLMAVPPLADGAAPIAPSLLLAAWAAEAWTAAASSAREILDGQDLDQPASVVFPIGVLALFVADVVPGDAALTPSSTAPSGLGFQRPAIAPQDSSQSVCQQFQRFSDDTVRSVFAAIGKLPNLGYRHDDWDWARWIANRGADLANFALTGLEYLTVNGVKTLIGPLVSIIATIASVVAVTTSVVLFLQPWSATIEPEPLTNQRGALRKPGRFNLTVRTAGPAPDRWPTQLAGCAQWAGVTLPSLTPQDADVLWTIDYEHPGPMIEIGQDSGRLSTDGTASLAYQTIVEPPEVARGDLQHDGTVAITATIHRTDLDLLRKQLIDLLYGQLPTIVRQTVGPTLRQMVEPAINQALTRITTLRDCTTTGFLAMTYHTPRDDEPTSTSAPPTTHRPPPATTAPPTTPASTSTSSSSTSAPATGGTCVAWCVESEDGGEAVCGMECS